MMNLYYCNRTVNGELLRRRIGAGWNNMRLIGVRQTLYS